MQEFMNKQLPGWIQKGVTSGLRNLSQASPALTIEQIREVVRSEQPKVNPFAEQVEKDRRKRANQKEKKILKQWMKEQIKEAKEAMEKRLAEQSER
jgi:hypothetical protein